MMFQVIYLQLHFICDSVCYSRVGVKGAVVLLRNQLIDKKGWAGGDFSMVAVNTQEGHLVCRIS